MVRFNDNARNVSTFHESKLLMNSTVSHFLKEQTFGVDRFTVNYFDDSKHTFPFNIENAL